MFVLIIPHFVNKTICAVLISNFILKKATFRVFYFFDSVLMLRIFLFKGERSGECLALKKRGGENKKMHKLFMTLQKQHM